MTLRSDSQHSTVCNHVRRVDIRIQSLGETIKSDRLVFQVVGLERLKIHAPSVRKIRGDGIEDVSTVITSHGYGGLDLTITC